MMFEHRLGSSKMTTAENVDPSTSYAGASTGREVISRGGEIEYRRTFELANPKARVLLLHGIAEHSGRYEHVGATLVDAGFSVLAYDHYGHGRSGGLRGYVPSFETFLDDVEDNLGELRDSGDPVILMGHSLGGLIATSYCVSGRPLPDVLLLSGPALGAGVPTWQRKAAPVLGRVAPKLFIKNEFDGSLLSKNPAVAAAYMNDPLRIPGATAKLGFETFNAMESTNANLSKLSVPTMVIHGGDDRVVPVHFSEPLGELPVTTRQVLPGLEHEILNEESWEHTMSTFINFANGALGLPR